MATLDRIYEPSRLRRGRLATTPAWYVDCDNGARWRFARKGDAESFIRAGQSCPQHEEGPWTCQRCLGIRIGGIETKGP